MADATLKLVPQLNQQLKISVAATRKSAKWQNKTMMWKDLLDKFEHPVETDETPAQWLRYNRDKQHDIKDVGGFVGGWLKKGRRQANNAEQRSLLTLDADFPDHNLWEDIPLIFDYTCAVYSTHAYTKDNPRMRIIIPLSRTVTAEEYIPIARKVAEMLGMNNFDDTTYQPERMMFWPSKSKGGEYFFEHQEGDLLDPDEVLAEYDDWTDSSYWPTSDREVEVHQRDIKRQGDPLTKPGIIGAFNRTYDIKAAIDTFLADIYAPSRNDDRYTFIDGTTSQGLVLYEDKFAYSNHGTDPASGQLCSAFDLVRIQKFHDLDDKAKPGTPVNKLPSYKAMNDFAMEDKTVYEEWQKGVTGSAVDDFDDEVVFEDDKKEEKKLEPWLTYSDKGVAVVNNFLLAQHILKDLPVFYNGSEFLRYNAKKGIWQPDAEEYLKSLMVKKYLVQLSKTSYLRETLAVIQGLTLKDSIFKQGDVNKLVLGNGVYDIKDKTFVNSFDPDLHARVKHPVKYDPDATCETFDGYLKWAVGEENMDFIYEWIGYLFYREYPIQKMLFLLGPGGSGKSTLTNVMRGLVGEDSYSVVSLQALMTNTFATSGLYQKTVNFDSDAKPEFLSDGSLLKTLTGEDIIYGDVKFEKPIKFYNFAKLTFAMNHMPPMRDFNGGLQRRAIIIPAKQKVTQAVKQQFPLKQMMKELPGVFNKAMDGLRRALDKGDFTISASARRELDSWIKNNDQVGRFIEDECVIDEAALTSGDDLYLAYTSYTESSGEKALGKYKFFQRLEELGYERKQKRGEGKRTKVWVGLKPAINEFD